MERETRGAAVGREGTGSIGIDQGVVRDIDIGLEVRKDTDIDMDGRIVRGRDREIEVRRGDTEGIEAEVRIDIGADMMMRIEEGAIIALGEVAHLSRRTREEAGLETDVDDFYYDC